jgi:hypothetical protein
MRAIAAKPRPGARIRTAVRREFILSGGEPILVRDVLARAYPRLKRFTSRYYLAVYRALKLEAVVVACNHRSRGRPNLWAPRNTLAT